MIEFDGVTHKELNSYDFCHDSVWIFFFFFSSRRRHTRLQGDWSSDVCSSDLGARHPEARGRLGKRVLLSKASLVIVPANLIQQWKNEIRKHTEGLELLV